MRQIAVCDEEELAAAYRFQRSTASPSTLVHRRSVATGLGCFLDDEKGTSMVNFDQSKMWQAIEARLARTDDPRHRKMLEAVIEHARAEADRNVERLMLTLVDDPVYHFWVGGRDVGPKGADGVRSYYGNFVADADLPKAYLDYVTELGGR